VTVLITGAAGGIGLATVDRFIAAGQEVVGIDTDEAVEGIRPSPFRGAVADVREPAAVEAAVGNAELSHMVSIAGRVVPEEHDLLEREPADATAGFESSLALNLTSHFTVIRVAYPRLLEADGDRSITLCSSINALGSFGVPAYSAAKAGLIGLMHGLAATVGQEGIRINVVAPGTTRTPLTEREAAEHGNPSRFEQAAEGTHLKKVGEPADVAAAIGALALELTHVTDQVLTVDGGQLLAH
jgi:NAD(P)-dependent dehydrogenase (short-subunit alcohol dehydrogenase family)